MANQVAARLQGDDYQHLYTWFHVLRLLKPKEKVITVVVENSDAGSIDDVTVKHEQDSNFPDSYHQVKYHVDHRSFYSATILTQPEGKGSSLLEKWYRSWRALIESRPTHEVEIYIVSTWTWDPDDGLGAVVSSQTNALKEDFFDAEGQTKLAKQQQRIISHLGSDTVEIKRFLRSLRFKLGYACWNELAEKTTERMEALGLRMEAKDLVASVGIVREWIKKGRQVIDRDGLEAEIKAYDLAMPANIERAVHVYLTTIKTHKFDIDPDYVIDWRDYFEGSATKKGHDLKNPEDWNKTLLPDLHAMEARINTETDCRLVKARGQARLSAWIAFGHAFSEVNRYTVEVEQGTELWRSDTPPNADFIVTNNGSTGEELNSAGTTVAVGVSVTGQLASDVRSHLQNLGEPINALLLLTPGRELGLTCLRNAGDAVALAQAVKDQTRIFVKLRGATRLLFYYFGPLSGACFIGHKLNAVCKEVVIMERSEPSYLPSFVLS